MDWQRELTTIGMFCGYGLALWLYLGIRQRARLVDALWPMRPNPLHSYARVVGGLVAVVVTLMLAMFGRFGDL